MVERTYAPVSRVDIERLYTDDWTPDSWRQLQERTVEILEEQYISAEQSRAIVYALRELEAQGQAVPSDAGDLYLLVRPILEALPGGYG